jgi:hypothetical protein
MTVVYENLIRIILQTSRSPFMSLFKIAFKHFLSGYTFSDMGGFFHFED